MPAKLATKNEERETNLWIRSRDDGKKGYGHSLKIKLSLSDKKILDPNSILIALLIGYSNRGNP